MTLSIIYAPLMYSLINASAQAKSEATTMIRQMKKLTRLFKECTNNFSIEITEGIQNSLITKYQHSDKLATKMVTYYHALEKLQAESLSLSAPAWIEIAKQLIKNYEELNQKLTTHLSSFITFYKSLESLNQITLSVSKKQKAL